MTNSDSNPKKLFRSTHNKLAGGVWGGVGEYLHVDPVVLRIGYITLTTFTGIIPGAIAYVAMIFVIPEEPPTPKAQETSSDEFSGALFSECKLDQNS